MIVKITNKGKLILDGEHLIYEKNLKDVLDNLGNMVLAALKMVDLSNIPELSNLANAFGLNKERSSDQFIAKIMGTTRQTIQRQKSNIDLDYILAERPQKNASLKGGAEMLVPSQ